MSSRRKPTARSSASEYYAAQHVKAGDLLEEIERLLLEAPNQPESCLEANWAHVGSLEYVTEKLEEVRTFLAGEEA